jgi:4-hydroxymandelate oxidase
MRFTRRRALQSLAGLSTMTPAGAQELIGEPPGRIAPLADLVNVYEVQAMARRKLAETAIAALGDDDRKALERITFRPRLMVNVSKLDLSTELLGEMMFSPIVVGPVSNQQTYHPDGEVATVTGAAAARALAIVSSRSSKPLAEIVSAAKTPIWFQLYPHSDVKVTIAAAQQALQTGCKAICLTVGVPYQPEAGARTLLQPSGNLSMNWAFIDQLRKSIKAPLILKGVMSPGEAQLAVSNGVHAIVVSNHGGMFTTGFAHPIEVLPTIADAVGGKIPILIDGSFRRGTDILKALALGARAVLLGRPSIWGLAAYGSVGVRGVLEMLQSELARNMALCGKPDIKSIDRTLVKIHRW